MVARRWSDARQSMVALVAGLLLVFGAYQGAKHHRQPTPQEPTLVDFLMEVYQPQTLVQTQLAQQVARCVLEGFTDATFHSPSLVEVLRQKHEKTCTESVLMDRAFSKHTVEAMTRMRMRMYLSRPIPLYSYSNASSFWRTYES